MPQGNGKMWLDNCRIFLGDFNWNKLHKGKLYEMQSDNTYHLYDVAYDSEADKVNEVYPDN